MPDGAAAVAAAGRRAGRGAGVPPVPVRPGQPAPAGRRRPLRRPAHRRRPDRRRAGPGRAAAPRRPSATAPTPSACASGSRSPPPCSSPRDLLVLDEPTNGLDPQGTREVRHLIGALAAEGTTVLRLQPPAVRGGAGLHPRRRDARGPAGRAGRRRPSCARARRRGHGCDTDQADAAARVLRELGLTDVLMREPATCQRRPRPARRRRRSSRRWSTPACRCAASRCSAPSLEDLFVSLTGEGFDVSG